MRGDRFYDETVSHAALAPAVLDYVKEHPGCQVTDVLDALEHLDHVKGGVSTLRHALLDLLDTGEIDDEREGHRRELFYEPDPAKRHGRWG